MKLIGQIPDPDDHTAIGHDGKEMLTVPCFTTCHYLQEVGDHTWARRGKNDMPLIVRYFCCKGSLLERGTCFCWTLKDKKEGKHIHVLQRIKKVKKSNMQIVEICCIDFQK